MTIDVRRIARELFDLHWQALSGLDAPRAIAALAERLDRLDLGQLSRLDPEARICFRYDPDSRRAWLDGSVHALVRRQGGWALLAVFSLHLDGRVRERAMQELCALDERRALPFVLLRLNDWVPEVRQAAQKALRAVLAPSNLEAVVAALPLIASLETKGRDDHRSTLEAIRALLRGADGRRALRRGAGSSEPGVRRVCHRFLLEDEAPDQELLRQALRDGLPAVRLDAFRALARLRPTPVALLELARADSFLPIRREAFRLLLAASPATAEQMVRDTLLDRSSGLRWEAAYAHWQRTRERAAVLYRRAVASETGRRQLHAVLGLGEHGDRADAALLLPFLSSARVALRRAAVRGLARLDGENQTERFLAALTDPSPGVSTDACRALIRVAIPPAAASRLEALVADTTARLALRRNALDALAAADRWRAIPALVRACADPDEQLATSAVDCVKRWLGRCNRSFVQPSAQDLAALTAALALPASRARLGDWTCRTIETIAR